MPVLIDNEIIIICAIFSFTLTLFFLFICIHSPIAFLALFVNFFILSCMGGQVYVDYQSKIKSESTVMIIFF